MDFNTKSGPHLSLQSGSGEVREARFRVSSNCPAVAKQFRYCVNPFVVSVELPGQKDPESGCGAAQYRVIDPAEAMAHGMRGEFDTVWFVCEHMGRIIE